MNQYAFACMTHLFLVDIGRPLILIGRRGGGYAKRDLPR